MTGRSPRRSRAGFATSQRFPLSKPDIGHQGANAPLIRIQFLDRSFPRMGDKNLKAKLSKIQSEQMGNHGSSSTMRMRC